MEIWISTPEDVIVQKIRRGRSKDLDDARDILAFQGTEPLDMPYIEKWCAEHQPPGRLAEIIGNLPEF